jgi:hypothetical protein
MSDLNFNQIPQKETENDIPNLFGSLQKMDSSNKDSNLVSLNWNSSTFA